MVLDIKDQWNRIVSLYLKSHVYEQLIFQFLLTIQEESLQQMVLRQPDVNMSNETGFLPHTIYKQ